MRFNVYFIRFSTEMDFSVSLHYSFGKILNKQPFSIGIQDQKGWGLMC
jgi:hypothetical protein